jgi:hypothetical protein
MPSNDTTAYSAASRRLGHHAGMPCILLAAVIAAPGVAAARPGRDGVSR